MRWASTLRRRLVVNGASIFGGEAISRAATALMAVVIARSFGPESLGHYGYALALSSVLSIVPDFGLHLFAVREMASAPSRLSEVFWGVHWLKLALSGAAAGIAVCIGEWGIADRGRRVIFYILMVRVFLQTFSQAAMTVFKAFERMKYVALLQCVNSSVVIVWVAVCVVLDLRLWITIAGLAAGQGVETGLGWLILRRLHPAPRFTMWGSPALGRIATACLPIGLTAVLLAINLRIDIFVLGRYGSSLALGQFHAAAWFVMATFLAASLLMTVLFPKLSRILADSGVRSGDYLSSLVKHALLFTAAGSLILWFCAPTLLRLFFGADFAPAAHTFRVLAPALPLVFLNTIFFYVFAASRRRFVCLGVLAFGIAAGTLLSIFLTSRYGTTGTATAHVAREFVTGNAYLLFLIQGNHARVAGLALIRVFLGAAVCMAAAVFVAAPFHIEMMWIGAWMVFVFVGALGMLGFPSAGEWRILTDDAP